jgi:hypothetical protein
LTGLDPYLREISEHGFREKDTPQFLALWERLETTYFDRIATVSAPQTGWRDCFRAAALETARLVEQYPANAHFLTVDALAAGELGRDRQRSLVIRAAALLDSARDEIADPDSVSESTSSWVAAMFFDRTYRRCINPDGPALPSQLPELMFLATSAYFGIEVGLEELIPPP